MRCGTQPRLLARFSPTVITSTSSASIGDGKWKIGANEDFEPFDSPITCLPFTQLYALSQLQVGEATKEVLFREIQHKESCDETKAEQILNQIHDDIQKVLILPRIPIQLSLGFTGILIIGSPLVVFSEPAATWFNDMFVTTEIPKEAGWNDTPLEISIWTWSFAEPTLGTLSFVILGFQLGARFLVSLGRKPYWHFCMARVKGHLESKYPIYNKNYLKNYVDSVTNS